MIDQIELDKAEDFQKLVELRRCIQQTIDEHKRQIEGLENKLIGIEMATNILIG